MLLIKYLILIFSIRSCNGEIFDFVNVVGNFLGYNSKDQDIDGDSKFENKIPYEVSTLDENFIAEAAKLSGTTLSQLDSCQHRVSDFEMP